MKRYACFIFASISLTCVLSARAAPLSLEQQAAHVLNRLAYGPRPGDVERVMHMGIDRYIDSQLNPESISYSPALTKRLHDLDIQAEKTGDTLGMFLSVRMVAKAAKADNDDAAKQKQREEIGRIVEQTAEARLARAIDSPRQLEEVMVDFWFNHFNVFSGKGLDRALISGYERDAIRPYVFGSFRDLLGATAKHPAMLFYLDNWLSTADGYEPRAFKKFRAQGKKSKANGLNENYARELMELHTLGVDGGYTQKDVTELARMLTGWTFNPGELARKNRMFHFDDARHDSGDKEWLGHHVSARGQQEGEMALDILAMHPSTARHLSYQLAQYFVQDNPPAALVDRMSRRYLETKGDIRSVLRILFSSAEFMSPSTVDVKFKTPYQFVISAARAADVPVENIRPLLGTLNQLGMPLYGCQTPDGYKNTEEAWLNPDALTRRISFAAALAAGRLPLTTLPDDSGNEKMAHQRLKNKALAMQRDGAEPSMPPLNASTLFDTLGTSISRNTRDTILNNPVNLRAALILGSPDFMQH